MHHTIEPSILYFGTPVALISTLNEDGSANLAPMSSVWWLGWRCLLGFGARSKTPQNLIRTRECVINLPSADLVSNVNRLAKLTGSDPIPEHKQKMGYRFERDKFAVAGLTPQNSLNVAAPRVLECPVQLEARLESAFPLAEAEPTARGRLVALEMRIVRVHVDEAILAEDKENHIDPDKWRPLIMSFQHFYGLTPRLHHSTLAEIPEAMYRPAVLSERNC